MTGQCYRPGKESGAWYELKCLRQVIDSKESRGMDASFERLLYKAWLKDPDFAIADKDNQRRGIYAGLINSKKPAPVIENANNGGNLPPAIITPPDLAISTIMKHEKAGRPRKEGEISRVTDWRRRKEALQGALI